MKPTREDVERMAKRFDVNAADWRWDEDHHAARDMLRALLARAEAAEAELAVEQEARELASESDAGWEQVANAARAGRAPRAAWAITGNITSACWESGYMPIPGCSRRCTRRMAPCFIPACCVLKLLPGLGPDRPRLFSKRRFS